MRSGIESIAGCIAREVEHACAAVRSIQQTSEGQAAASTTNELATRGRVGAEQMSCAVRVSNSRTQVWSPTKPPLKQSLQTQNHKMKRSGIVSSIQPNEGTQPQARGLVMQGTNTNTTAQRNVNFALETARTLAHPAVVCSGLHPYSH